MLINQTYVWKENVKLLKVKPKTITQICLASYLHDGLASAICTGGVRLQDYLFPATYRPALEKPALSLLHREN